MTPARYRKLVSTTLTKDFREAAEIVEMELRDPAPDEIVVRNRYAGVNATDVNISAGLYAPGKLPPLDLGVEATGEVVAVGSDVDGFDVGDAVVTMNAGYSEYLTVRTRWAIPVPEAAAEVMSLVVSGLTASFGLELVGEMKSDETVLVTAAAGGTGHIAVQLAKLADNHVIGTCSTPGKAALLESLGCDRVVNYREENLGDMLASEYSRGVDLVYESVGREMFDTCVDHLARRGRLVIIGYISEYMDEPELVTDVRIYHKLLSKSASIRGMFLSHFRSHIPSHLAKLVGLLNSGKLHVQMDAKKFSGIESVVEAVEYLHSGKSSGKVVVRL